MIRFSAIIADGSFPCATAILQGPLEETFRRAREAGYDAVQFTIKDVSEYPAEECRRLMERYSLAVSAMATGRVYSEDGLSMGAGDETNRRACVERLCAMAELSHALGNPAIVIGAVRGRFTDAASPEEYRRQFDKSVEELLRRCEPLGVPVILESFNHVEADVCYRPEETLRYVNSFRSGVFHMYLDVMHMDVEGLDPAEMILAYGKDAFSIDISGEERRAPMLSRLDFRGIVRAIRASGFAGTLTFEMPPAPPENSAGESLAYIRQLLEEAP